MWAQVSVHPVLRSLSTLRGALVKQVLLRLLSRRGNRSSELLGNQLGGVGWRIFETQVDLTVEFRGFSATSHSDGACFSAKSLNMLVGPVFTKYPIL